MAQLLYRKGLYVEAFEAASKALSVNTYDPLANYLHGLSAQQRSQLTAAYDPDDRLTAALKAYAKDKKMGDLEKVKHNLPKKEQEIMESMLK